MLNDLVHSRRFQGLTDLGGRVAAGPWLVLAFPVLWLHALASMSFISGWWSLAQQYRAQEPPPPTSARMVSGTIGLISFNGILGVRHSDAGLWLSLMPLFRPFFPPLLIPWSDIRWLKRGSYWFVLRDTLEVPGPVRIRLPVKVTSAFEARLGPRLEP